MKLIDKDALVAEIKRRKEINKYRDTNDSLFEDEAILSFLNSLEVKNPYEQTVQYDSIKAGIQAHAEIYSFNIESKLFNQLTEEQQKLWRKEIEQACISGGEAGVELARDIRYKENLEVKEADFEKELDRIWFDNKLGNYFDNDALDFAHVRTICKHFFELGIKNAERMYK